MNHAQIERRIAAAVLAEVDAAGSAGRTAVAHGERCEVLRRKAALARAPEFQRLPDALQAVVLALPSMGIEQVSKIVALCERAPDLMSLADFRDDPALLAEIDLNGFPESARAVVRAWPRLPQSVRDVLAEFSFGLVV